MDDKKWSNLQNIKYFPNLNGIRFIAAFSVLIHHIEQAKYAFHLPSIYANHIIKNLGKLGVGLFFVLSGFLITYLLLSEKSKSNDINIRHFYMRRILRIWPIYFLIVLLSFFVFPHIPFFTHIEGANFFSGSSVYKGFSLFLILLPNLSFILYGSPYLCSQTWSIGVEELFYYIWPWVVKFPNFKSILLTISIFCLSLTLIVVGYVEVVGGTLLKDYEEIGLLFLGQFRIVSLLLGGLMATLLMYKKIKILSILFRRDLQYIVYGLFLISLFFNLHPYPLNSEYYALFFAYFVLNLASNPDSILNLEYKWINYLGKISYGLYIYQTAMVVFSIRILQWVFNNNTPTLSFNILLYTLSIGFTFITSALSFHYFEHWFLTLKHRFSSERSSPQK